MNSSLWLDLRVFQKLIQVLGGALCYRGYVTQYIYIVEIEPVYLSILHPPVKLLANNIYPAAGDTDASLDSDNSSQCAVYCRVKKVMPPLQRGQAFFADVDHTSVFQVRCESEALHMLQVAGNICCTTFCTCRNIVVL